MVSTEPVFDLFLVSGHRRFVGFTMIEGTGDQRGNAASLRIGLAAHWDFDLPSTIVDLPFLSGQAKRNILGESALKLFRLDRPRGK